MGDTPTSFLEQAAEVGRVLEAQFVADACNPGRGQLGVGRFGGIAGSLLVAELSRRELEFSQVFMVLAVAALVAAAALLVKLFGEGGKPSAGPAFRSQASLH